MMNHWLFRCRDISELISKSMDGDTPFHIRMGIKFHLMMCHLCRRYKAQLDLIQNAITLLDRESGFPEKKLPQNFKDSLKQQLD